MRSYFASFFFFFNDTATTEIYTLSLHDALPIFNQHRPGAAPVSPVVAGPFQALAASDRKSTRLNSSHLVISYAVFCLKKKKQLSCVTSFTILSCPQPPHSTLLSPDTPSAAAPEH